ncbi:MAG: Ig-like domain-containing protein [Prevotellaceae bacterium]|nr:Ig-like domain-containing protein [Prevotellaceae bacterium]
MIKTLRYSLMSLLVLVCGSVYAQKTTLWTENFGSYAANDVPTAGDYGYVCVGSGTKIYTQNLAGGESPELLIGKSGGSFSVNIPMNGNSGEMTLRYKANYDRITVTSEDATIGEKSNTGNDYSIPVTVAAGKASVTIVFTNSSSSNVRFDDAELFFGVSKKAPGLSWGTASREVTIGSEDNSFPTLSNENNLAVAYSSDNTEVATIDAEGNITLVAAGTANITAEFAGNDEYEAGSVTYKLTVNAAPDPSVDITNTPETAYSVAKANELIAAGQGLDTKVYVVGTITYVKEVSTSYGNATYYVGDGTEQSGDDLMIYRGYYYNGDKFTAEDQIKVGDKVIVYGKLVDYNGTKEMTSGSSIYSINGTTGITTVKTQSANGTIYNLAGQQRSKLAKGINIVNGKKVVK